MQILIQLNNYILPLIRNKLDLKTLIRSKDIQIVHAIYRTIKDFKTGAKNKKIQEVRYNYF